MANKSKPVITYMEILCLAIRTLDADIAEWYERLGEEHKEYADKATAEMGEKRKALLQLYQLETGTAYE